jgi:hypothetical protein
MRRLVAVMSVVLWASLAQAQVELEATVNATRIGVQDALQLTVSISGPDGGRASEPELPSIEGFRVAGRSTSSQIQIINGQMSSTKAFIYQLLPQEEGTFTIGAVTVTANGKTYRSEPITVEVVAGSVAPRTRRRSVSPFGGMDPFDDDGMPFGRRRDRTPELQEGDVYVRAEVSKPTVFEGEQVVVTYRLFSRYVPLGPDVEDDPPMTGFWMEEVDLGKDTPIERRTIDGKAYLTAPIKQRVLFPTKTGTLTIPPITFTMAFRVSSNDPFDSFFARASRPVRVRSQPVELQVKPLPTAGRSREFEGAVGQFQLEAELNKEEVAAGEPVTLTLSLQGKGNLRAVEAPDLPDVEGFRTFAPKASENYHATSAGIGGEKSWEYVLVPESSGEKELGPWDFPFFDPEKASYVMSSAGPLSLHVTGGVMSSAGGDISSPSANSDVTLLRQDIRYLKPPPKTLGVPQSPFYKSTLFYLSLLAPVLWNLGFVVYLRRKQNERIHSDFFRSRRAHRMARERLGRAAKLARDSSKTCYEEVAAALYRYVADKTSLSASGLTSQTIDGLLKERKVPEELRKEFLEVLDRCEEARFTPGERTREEMESLLNTTEELIVALDRHWA